MAILFLFFLFSVVRQRLCTLCNFKIKYIIFGYLFPSTIMSFFRRKGQNEIPPVEPKGPPPSRSPAPGSKYSYVESRDRNRYDDNQQPSSGGYRGGYEGGAGGYNPPRDGAQDALRSELFAGYNPERAGPNRFADNARGPELREPAPGEENEEDVEGIKQQVRATKQESVNSTRNALRLAREAEDSARGTLLKLGDQSGASLSTYHSYKVLILCIPRCREARQYRTSS